VDDAYVICFSLMSSNNVDIESQKGHNIKDFKMGVIPFYSQVATSGV
jgi:hypothetical protein